MTAALPYLRALRKSELQVLAEAASLKEYVASRLACRKRRIDDTLALFV